MGTAAKIHNAYTSATVDDGAKQAEQSIAHQEALDRLRKAIREYQLGASAGGTAEAVNVTGADSFPPAPGSPRRPWWLLPGQKIDPNAPGDLVMDPGWPIQ